ncbi:MAG: hypothetical protein ACOYWZ_00240 [Bacillota bacterium]
MGAKKLIKVKLVRVKTLDALLRKGSFAFLRFFIYGMVGVFAEVCNYTFVKIGRMIPVTSWAFMTEWSVDERLNLNNIWEAPWYTFYGQCSLWMFPVNGLCSVLILERIYKLSRRFNLNWIVRGTLYSIAITIFELIAGFILLWTTGYKIWYYSDAGHILNMTSVFLFFTWFAAGMLVEFIYRELLESNLRNRAMDIYKVVSDVIE